MNVQSVSPTETVLAPGWGEPSGQPPAFLVQADVDGQDFAFHMHEGGSAAEQSWRCAQALMDAAQEAVGSTPYPPCPGHRHPMAVERDGERVYWCCPEARRVPVAPITQGA
ncbi:hypothetical protein [Streptacidiphilus neutrinimicus]|uniref:hypothetical protein n=1 Tax=Streptacidiphilus neutrinimicus TaxID=105420 RepID=UPI0006944BB5|nr:hypothetical protein [Streptacidiphilus neutrinimicus]